MASRQPADEPTSAVFLRPLLLLLLAEGPTHGYDLIEQVKPFEPHICNPSRIYRALHALEESQLVRPSWHTDGPGPARRVYALTPAGRRALESTAASLDVLSDKLVDYLVRYRGLRQRSGEAEGCFEVLVEAKLSVRAPDQASAQRKVKDVFAKPRRFATNVWSKGPAWVYGGGAEAGT